MQIFLYFDTCTFDEQVFGDGSVAQFVLSKGELGSAHSIHWSWGVGVMMGLYASGGISGNYKLLV